MSVLTKVLGKFIPSARSLSWRPAVELNVTASEATTDTLDKCGFSGGSVLIPTGSSLTALTIYGAQQVDGEFGAAYNAGGTTALTMTVAAARVVKLPVDVDVLAYIRFKGNTTGKIYVMLFG